MGRGLRSRRENVKIYDVKARTKNASCTVVHRGTTFTHLDTLTVFAPLMGPKRAQNEMDGVTVLD